MLRFWDLCHIPYTHDEISGLVRTGYATFGELIEHGVAVDAHPPGVAVFLHYWTKLFGYDESVVKAPFIVLSIIALFLLYRFTLAWTNGTVALLLVALLATIQYTVMYAQIARPYAAGFFTCALLADQWTRFLAGGPRSGRTMAGMALGFALCAYMHHFALLFAALVGLTGLVLVQRTQRRAYLIAAFLAILAYLPNVPIFFRQLGYGGVGQWLAAPDRHWVPEYAAWVFQYDRALAGTIAALMLLSLGFRFMKRQGSGPILWVGLFWGIAPLLIGFAYSVWVDPVLQYSVLLFSFPFLIIACLHGLPEVGPKAVVVIVVVAVMGATGLIRDRRHYAVFYDSQYETMIREGLAVLAAEGPDKAAVLLDAPDEVVRFYMRSWRIPPETFPYFRLRARGGKPTLPLDSLLITLRGRTILYGESNGAPNEQAARIQARFPTLTQRRDIPGGQTFVLTDTRAGTGVKDRGIIAHANPDGRTNGAWEIHEDLPLHRDIHGNAWDLTGRAFGVAVELLLDTIMHHPQDRIEVIAQVSGMDADSDVGLVLELLQEDVNLFYSTGEASALGAWSGRVPLVVAAQRAYVPTPGPVLLRAYLFNRNKGPLLVHRFIVLKREGNHALYGLTSPITEPCTYRPGPWTRDRH